MRGLVFDEVQLPPDLPLSSAEIISKLNMHLLHVLDVSIRFFWEPKFITAFWKLFLSHKFEYLATTVTNREFQAELIKTTFLFCRLHALQILYC